MIRVAVTDFEIEPFLFQSQNIDENHIKKMTENEDFSEISCSHDFENKTENCEHFTTDLHVNLRKVDTKDNCNKAIYTDNDIYTKLNHGYTDNKNGFSENYEKSGPKNNAELFSLYDEKNIKISDSKYNKYVDMMD